ncbi:MAG: MarC family protein [Brumimicrobium sp.]|nr:MarC family protein [Brumimicrobium sp.]
MGDFFLSISLNEIFKATMVLFAVIDIIGSIPIILKYKESIGQLHAPRITFVSTIIMIAFLIAGEQILKLFGVNVESFAVAGSLILFAMAIEMVMGVELFKEQSIKGKSAGIVPIAFPVIAGAGSMTTLISLRAEYAMINILIAIVINMVIVLIVLRLTRRIERVLGAGGIAILKKVFGIILLAIAIKLFAGNVTSLFK